MHTLGRLLLRTDISVANPKELEERANSQYAMTDSALTKLPEIQEPGVVVRVREGSLEIVIVIWTTATTLVSLISDYGSFRSGLRDLIQDVRAALEWVRTKFRERGQDEGTHLLSSRLTTGRLTQLNGILKKVEWGEISSDEAIEMVIRIFERAGEEIPKKFKRYLLRSFQAVPQEKEPPPPRPVRSSSSAYRRPRYGRGFEVRRNPGAEEVIRRPLKPEGE